MKLVRRQRGTYRSHLDFQDLHLSLQSQVPITSLCETLSALIGVEERTSEAGRSHRRAYNASEAFICGEEPLEQQLFPFDSGLAKSKNDSGPLQWKNAVAFNEDAVFAATH